MSEISNPSSTGATAANTGTPQGATAASPHKFAGPARVLIPLGLLLGVAAFGFGTYWFVKGRFLVSTEDAYIQADSVAIAPKVGGYVDAVLVVDNQMVKKGDVIVRLDRVQYLAALDKAHADIGNLHAGEDRIRAQIKQQEAQLMQAEAQQKIARLALQYAIKESSRYQPLASSGASTDEHLAQLENTRDQAQVQLHVSDAEVKAASGRIEESKAELAAMKAQVEGAQAQGRRSQQDVDDTVLRSPIDGKVGDRGVRMGQLVQPGTRLMSIVPVTQLYVAANFKETQLGEMHAGQSATLTVDALPDVHLHGTVESFAPGTGSEFALLPPENATGNFTKIVQRVPVRIRFNTAELPPSILPGMSVHVEVDTHNEAPSHG